MCDFEGCCAVVFDSGVLVHVENIKSTSELHYIHSQLCAEDEHKITISESQGYVNQHSPKSLFHKYAMSEITGKFELVKNENFTEYLIAQGVAEDTARALDARKSKLEIRTNGDEIQITSDSTNVPNKFVLGQEVQETLGNNIMKSVATRHGNAIKIKSTDPRGIQSSRTYELSGNDLFLTISTDRPGVSSCKRYYKKI